MRSLLEGIIEGQVKQYERNNKSAETYKRYDDNETSTRYNQSAISDMAIIQKLMANSLIK